MQQKIEGQVVAAIVGSTSIVFCSSTWLTPLLQTNRVVNALTEKS